VAARKQRQSRAAQGVIRRGASTGRSVRCAGVTHEIVRMVEGWVVGECEAAAGRRLDRSLRQVRERAGRRRDCRGSGGGGGGGEIGEVVVEGECGWLIG
jgi:hypothetical protein